MLSDGTRSLAITTNGLAAELTGWALDRLQLLPPAGFTGDMALTLRATSTEPGNGASAGVGVGFTLRVLTGMAAVTPVTLNGYVTPLASASRTSGSAMTVEAPVTVLDEQLSRAAAAHSLSATTRTPQDEVALAAERARALSDA